MLYLYAGWMLVMNLIDFFLMFLDKQKARRNKWRIPEKTLFGFALLGGALGGYLGMKLFRHKTRHPLFYIGLPTAFILHALLATALFYYGVL